MIDCHANTQTDEYSYMVISGFVKGMLTTTFGMDFRII